MADRHPECSASQLHIAVPELLLYQSLQLAPTASVEWTERVGQSWLPGWAFALQGCTLSEGAWLGVLARVDSCASFAQCSLGLQHAVCLCAAPLPSVLECSNHLHTLLAGSCETLRAGDWRLHFISQACLPWDGMPQLAGFCSGTQDTRIPMIVQLTCLARIASFSHLPLSGSSLCKCAREADLSQFEWMSGCVCSVHFERVA